MQARSGNMIRQGVSAMRLRSAIAAPAERTMVLRRRNVPCKRDEWRRFGTAAAPRARGGGGGAANVKKGDRSLAQKNQTKIWLKPANESLSAPISGRVRGTVCTKMDKNKNAGIYCVAVDGSEQSADTLIPIAQFNALGIKPRNGLRVDFVVRMCPFSNEEKAFRVTKAGLPTLGDAAPALRSDDALRGVISHISKAGTSGYAVLDEQLHFERGDPNGTLRYGFHVNDITGTGKLIGDRLQIGQTIEFIPVKDRAKKVSGAGGAPIRGVALAVSKVDNLGAKAPSKLVPSAQPRQEKVFPLPAPGRFRGRVKQADSNALVIETVESPDAAHDLEQFSFDPADSLDAILVDGEFVDFEAWKGLRAVNISKPGVPVVCCSADSLPSGQDRFRGYVARLWDSGKKGTLRLHPHYVYSDPQCADMHAEIYFNKRQGEFAEIGRAFDFTLHRTEKGGLLAERMKAVAPAVVPAANDTHLVQGTVSGLCKGDDSSCYIRRNGFPDVRAGPAHVMRVSPLDTSVVGNVFSRGKKIEAKHVNGGSSVKDITHADGTFICASNSLIYPSDVGSGIALSKTLTAQLSASAFSNPSSNPPVLTKPTFLEYTCRNEKGNITMESITSVGGLPLTFPPPRTRGMIPKLTPLTDEALSDHPDAIYPEAIITMSASPHTANDAAMQVLDGELTPKAFNTLIKRLPKIRRLRVLNSSFENPAGGNPCFREDAPVEFQIDERRNVAVNITAPNGVPFHFDNSEVNREARNLGVVVPDGKDRFAISMQESDGSEKLVRIKHPLNSSVENPSNGRVKLNSGDKIEFSLTARGYADAITSPGGIPLHFPPARFSGVLYGDWIGATDHRPESWPHRRWWVQDAVTSATYKVDMDSFRRTCENYPFACFDTPIEFCVSESGIAYDITAAGELPFHFPAKLPSFESMMESLWAAPAQNDGKKLDEVLPGRRRGTVVRHEPRRHLLLIGAHGFPKSTLVYAPVSQILGDPDTIKAGDVVDFEPHLKRIGIDNGRPRMLPLATLITPAGTRIHSSRTVVNAHPLASDRGVRGHIEKVLPGDCGFIRISEKHIDASMDSSYFSVHKRRLQAFVHAQNISGFEPDEIRRLGGYTFEVGQMVEFNLLDKGFSQAPRALEVTRPGGTFLNPLEFEKVFERGSGDGERVVECDGDHRSTLHLLPYLGMTSDEVQTGREGSDDNVVPLSEKPRGGATGAQSASKQKKKKKKRVTPVIKNRVVELPSQVTVRELSQMSGIPLRDMMKKIVEYELYSVDGEDSELQPWILNLRTEMEGQWPPVPERVLSNAASDMSLGVESCELLLHDFGVDTKRWEPPFEDEVRTTVHTASNADSLRPRSPVVTIMGHVDHGKTTLLDALRNTRVASGEAGGITQAVSSFKVNVSSEQSSPVQEVVFIDTPGHEAFASMRECGAMLTDIVVLVVAATDGVRQQTIESIQHAHSCGVPIVVALTKCDVDGIEEAAESERIANELMAAGVQCESLGGDVQIIPISSLRGDGLPELLEALALEAEMMELKASFSGRGEAVVLESTTQKGKGAVCEALVRWGAMKRGDVVVVGHQYGKIRSLLDTVTGKAMPAAKPVTPVRLVGLKSAALPGADILVVKNEKVARKLIENRTQYAEQIGKNEADSGDGSIAAARSGVRDAEDAAWYFGSDSSLIDPVSNLPMTALDVPQVPFILKADTEGSMSALKHSIKKMEEDRAMEYALKGGPGYIAKGTPNAEHTIDDEEGFEGIVLPLLRWYREHYLPSILNEVPERIHVPLGFNVYEDQLHEAGVDYSLIDAAFQRSALELHDFVYEKDAQPLHFPLGKAVQYIRCSKLYDEDDEERDFEDYSTSNIGKYAKRRPALDAIGLEWSPPESYKVINDSLGDVSKTDLEIAKSFNARIFGFNVNCPQKIFKAYRGIGMHCSTNDVIYRLLDEIGDIIDPSSLQVERSKIDVQGRADVLQVFEMNKVKGAKSSQWNVAGSNVVEGTIRMGDRVRVIRNDQQIAHNLKMDSLRHMKQEVSSISNGMECGIHVKGFDDFEAGDIIQTYTSAGDGKKT